MATTRHACDVVWGQPAGIRPGDVHRCTCGKDWLALAGSRGICWIRISRVRAVWRQVTRRYG